MAPINDARHLAKARTLLQSTSIPIAGARTKDLIMMNLPPQNIELLQAALTLLAHPHVTTMIQDSVPWLVVGWITWVCRSR